MYWSWSNAWPLESQAKTKRNTPNWLIKILNNMWKMINSAQNTEKLKNVYTDTAINETMMLRTFFLVTYIIWLCSQCSFYAYYIVGKECVRNHGGEGTSMMTFFKLNKQNLLKLMLLTRQTVAGWWLIGQKHSSVCNFKRFYLIFSCSLYLNCGSLLGKCHLL